MKRQRVVNALQARAGNVPKAREVGVLKTVQVSKEAYFRGQEVETVSLFEFLFEQVRFIRKYVWLLQVVVLMVLWVYMYGVGFEMQVSQRVVSVGAPMFAIVLIPELWKNVRNRSVEIENCAYFTLRKVYAVRMTLLGMIDLFLLSLFFGGLLASSGTVAFRIMAEFFVPFNVTCCIYLLILNSQRILHEYVAVAYCLVWTALWMAVVSSGALYEGLVGPIWGALLGISLGFLGFAVRKILKDNRTYYEEEMTWN